MYQIAAAIELHTRHERPVYGIRIEFCRSENPIELASEAQMLGQGRGMELLWGNSTPPFAYADEMHGAYTHEPIEIVISPIDYP